jgi:hypothetical protein
LKRPLFSRLNTSKYGKKKKMKEVSVLFMRQQHKTCPNTVGYSVNLHEKYKFLCTMDLSSYTSQLIFLNIITSNKKILRADH